MKTAHRAALLTLLCAAGFLHGADRPYVLAPLVEAPPVLEADMADPAWTGGARIRLDQALGESTGAPVRLATEVTVLRTDDALYLRYACANPAAPDLKTRTRNRDDEAYGDESVELFLDTQDGSDYYHFVVNASGSIYDGRKFNKAWNGAWTTAVHQTTGGWEAGVAIPFDTPGGPPSPGVYWLLNLCRNAYDANGKGEHSAWLAPGYHRPLGLLCFGDIDATPLLRKLGDKVAFLRRIEAAGGPGSQTAGARVAAAASVLEASVPDSTRVAPVRFVDLLASAEAMSREIEGLVQQAILHTLLDRQPAGQNAKPEASRKESSP